MCSRLAQYLGLSRPTRQLILPQPLIMEKGKEREKGEKTARESGTDADVQETKNAAALEREPTFKDYVRVFSYATTWDVVLMVAAAIASVGAGITMPLMNVVFGRLVGSFTSYAGSDEQVLHAFEDTLNKQSLFMFVLFIARFGLDYINKVWRSEKVATTYLTELLVFIPHSGHPHVGGNPVALPAVSV